MNAQCHACIGGTNVREDMRKLETGVHVVVGTPGRVYDMISRRALSKYFNFSIFFLLHIHFISPKQKFKFFFFFLGTNHIKLFVLDEADEMLSRGFKDQIHDVFKNLNAEVQVRIAYDYYFIS